MNPVEQAKEMYDQTWELLFSQEFNKNDSAAVAKCKKETIATIDKVFNSRGLQTSPQWDKVKDEIEKLIIN